MSWLTRAELRRDDSAQKALTALLLDAGERDVGHRLVWSLFADDPDATRDFLYREAEPGRFLIVSARAPSDPKELWSLQSKPYAPEFTPGQRLGFALRANPAQSVKTPGRDRGVRVDAVMHAKTLAPEPLDSDQVEQAALDWLFAREAHLGVRFDRPCCAAGGYRQVRIGRKGAKPIRHSVVDYEGALEVADPAVLAGAVTQGVGKARAYGCGLLMLRPLAA
jgi:CRISPR system Cascade subunit CasE